MASANEKKQRSTKPVKPENSALADELRHRLKGKPTQAGFSRSWIRETGAFIWDCVRIVIVFVLCVCFIFGGFGAGMLLGYASTTRPLSIGDLTSAEESQTSFVYDSDGNVMAKLTGSENVDRIYVSYSDVRHTYIDEAIIAVEDERFYSHSGIDLKRIGSAVLSALAHGGKATYGGSTITQQTVKLISGQDEHSTSRKVQEWFSAMSLEQDLSKDEILELYINLAPMGNNYVGIQAAAQNYFGKDARDLTLPECALIAGLPKSPSYYNPLRETGRRNALRRMRIILGMMRDQNKITEKEYQDALNTEVVFKSRSKKSVTINSYFTEYVISEVVSDLAKARGISKHLASSLVYNRGYHIYSTMEKPVQDIIDETFKSQRLFQRKPAKLVSYPEKPNGSCVVINVKTGAISAMAGGYGEKTMNLSLNRAVSTYRNPGSSIKPLIAYGPALELGIIAPGTIVNDRKVYLDPQNPKRAWPVNYERNYAGHMTIRNALSKSRNTIAAEVWTKVGGDTALWYLKQVGIDRTAEGAHPSQAVGGFSKGMTTLEMAAAYATIASGGTYTAPYAYTKVLDSEGKIVIESKPLRYRVYSKETCYLLTSILKDVVTSGWVRHYGAQIKNSKGKQIDAAAKTGTTSDNIDKWFCGYTSYYSAAVWYGYDNRLKQTKIPKEDWHNVGWIWEHAMQNIHRGFPATSFKKPANVVKVSYCTKSGMAPNEHCREAKTVKTDYFVKGSYLYPKEECKYHTAPSPAPTGPVKPIKIITPTPAPNT